MSKQEQKAPKPPKCGSFMQIKGDEVQTLTASAEDGGGGAYLVIKTKRWAIDSDDIDKFAAAMKRIVNLPEEYFP